MIANDIIDISFAQKSRHIHQERYWKKVVSSSELDWIKSQSEPFLSFLAIWAAKEVAYKLASKLGQQRAFIPKKLILRDLEKLEYHKCLIFSCQSPQGSFSIQVHTSPEYIKASGALDPLTLSQAYFESFPLQKKSYPHQSKYCRAALKGRISNNFNIRVDKLSIRKENSIPILYISHTQSNLDISISHHGNWGSIGYAMHESL